MVYTFPMPPQAVLLGFACELDGKRQDGRVVARAEGERDYERALAEGNAPVLLESLPGGLHTANIGNLQPGEEMVLELRLAQLLMFEQGRLRLAIPMTIAPRYGSAAAAGLQPQQVPHASMQAAYPLSLEVTVAGELALAELECPTHRVVWAQVADGVRLSLAPGAWLDRDVVITVTPRAPQPALLVHARDERSADAPIVALAALQPPQPAPRTTPLTLKLLLDCSGSMAGDSIASARRALRGVMERLRADDLVSLSRFGSSVEHKLLPNPFRPALQRRLMESVDRIEADLGGTEMTRALQAVFELDGPDGPGGDVLLLTDGEIWQVDEAVRVARESGHRVFVIGVGASPSEANLRALVHACGGACEFVTPGEALEAAARRMLERIRQHPWQPSRIDWGREPLWKTPLPAQVFGGDTVIVMAGFAGGEPPTQASLIVTGGQGESVELACARAGGGGRIDGSTDGRAEGQAEDQVGTRSDAHANAPADTPTACPGDALPRLAAARRLPSLDDAGARALALQYQLIGPHTSCVLVHPRTAADKPDELAQFHRVDSMLAAGWGGTGSVMMSGRVASASSAPRMRFGVDSDRIDGFCTPSVWRTGRMQKAAPLGASSATQGDDLSDGIPFNQVVSSIEDWLARGTPVEDLEASLQNEKLEDEVEQTLQQVMQLGLSRAQAMLLMVRWLHWHRSVTLTKEKAARLDLQLLAIDAAQVPQAEAIFQRELAHWTRQGRLQRFLQAL